MLRLALATLRSRAGAFAATFTALLLAAAVVSACGVLLESGLRSALPPERYDKAPVIVAASPSAELEVKSADGSLYRSAQPLPERSRLDASLADAIAAIDGVTSVVPDRRATVRLLAGAAPSPERTAPYPRHTHGRAVSWAVTISPRGTAPRRPAKSSWTPTSPNAPACASATTSG